ncbi:MAG: peptidase [Burkholderiales bacterium RIFCSPLOWO2_12_FULL_61_40]|nr:MAG: peptidase [Burkholderiales bacterium RIFCSPLOWO2_12_FULL_61_40]
MRRKTLLLALITAGLVMAATSAAFGVNPLHWFSPKNRVGAAPADPVAVAMAQVPTPAPATVPPLPSGSTPNFRAIVQAAGPAVVGVTVAGLHTAEPDEFALDLNDPFFQFFRGLPGFQWRIPGQGQGGAVPFRSQGSGFIINSDGLILTNAHVVREAKEVTVKLSDRREFKARVLGSDPSTDIAVLRINAKNLPVVRLGDAQQLQVGDPVLAIGSPFGFEQSATQGIVSAKGRSLPGDAAVPFIQTDVAVNPGNSGGPLFDGTGAVVGINAQIYSQSGGYQGLSFAIPINVALKVKDQIVATGQASHARLGVTVQDLNQALAESFGLARLDGALVTQVAPDSAAASAGLRPGDVITEFNGEPIPRAGDLSSRISLSTPGETVRLQVWHDKAAREVTVKLGRAGDGARPRAQRDAKVAPGQLGLSLRPLTRDELSKAGLQDGLLVQGVAGAAARAGLLPGDVLLDINGTPLKSVDQVKAVLEKKPKGVALLVLRDGDRLFVPVELE